MIEQKPDSVDFTRKLLRQIGADRLPHQSEALCINRLAILAQVQGMAQQDDLLVRWPFGKVFVEVVIHPSLTFAQGDRHLFWIVPVQVSEIVDEAKRVGHLLQRALRRAYQDGTKAMIFEPLTFIEKLCALVPPPRQHLVTYHGVPAPNARFRDLVVPNTKEGHVCRRGRKNPIPLETAGSEEKRRRYTFAELMRRVFYVEVLRCPHCQGKRELVAMITEAPVIRAILECLKLPADPPAIAEARWPKGLFAHT